MTSFAMRRGGLFVPARFSDVAAPGRPVGVRVDRRLVRPEHRPLAEAIGGLLKWWYAEQAALDDLIRESHTDAMEADILKAETGQATSILSTTPITPYIALFTVTPGETGGGTEVTGSSYARQTGASKFAAPSGTSPTSVSSNAAITFPAVTSTGYTVVGCALQDALTTGNMLRWQTITSQAFAVGDQANFPSASIVFTED